MIVKVKPVQNSHWCSYKVVNCWLLITLIANCIQVVNNVSAPVKIDNMIVNIKIVFIGDW